MISVLLIFLLFAVLQVAVLFYVRTIVAASTADGARYAASSNVAAVAGGSRASDEIARTLGLSVANGLRCTGTLGTDAQSGLRTTVVHCAGAIRSVFLPLGDLVRIDVTSRALTEAPS